MDQQQEPWPRAQRKTYSCSECRRRKQKCNQGHPCSNCKRRFPEPICEYGSAKKRRRPPGSPRAFPVSLPATSPRSFQLGSRARRLTRSPVSGGAKGLRTGPVARWAGVDIETEYPLVEEVDADDGQVWETLPPQVDGAAAAAARRKRAAKAPAITAGPASSPGPSSRRRQLIQQPGQRILQLAGQQNLWQLAGPVHAMSGLPIELSHQNALLIHTYSHVHYHFKGSITGSDTDPDNPYVKYLVPFCLQSPLLVNTSIYIAAQPLCEKGYIDFQTTMALKVNTIRLLNSYLRSDACTTDEVMGAVGAFITIELYYGTAVDMRAHLTGLRGMVQLRGGFPDSPAGVLSSRVALVADAVIAVSLEEPAILQKSASFPYEVVDLAELDDSGDGSRPSRSALRSHFNSPFLPPRVPFSSCTAELGLHPATAWILDEMAFLINAVLELGPDAPAAEVEKVQATARWIHARIEQLPADSPNSPARAASSSPAPSSSPPSSQSEADVDIEPSVVNFQSGEPTPPPDDDEGPATPHSLLPRYPELETSPRAAAAEAPTPPPSPGRAAADYLYRAVRLSGMLWAQAIEQRQPLSMVCTPADALAIMGACWRIPLAEWRRVISIFVFVMMVLVPTTYKIGGDEGPIRVKVHTRFAKSIVQIGWMQVSIESWSLCKEMMHRTLALQGWLGST